MLPFLILAAAGVYAAPRVPIHKEPEDLIIRFKDSFSGDESAKFRKEYGSEPFFAARVSSLIEKKYGLRKTKTHLTNVPFTVYRPESGAENLKVIVKKLSEDPAVLYAQPNYFRYTLATTGYVPMAQPNDPIYKRTFGPVPAVDKWGISSPNQWGFNIIRADLAFNSGFISQIPARQVRVAVLDTGVKLDHPDLANSLISGRNIRNPSLPPEDDDTEGGHGTRVAGIIAAETNNGTGMAGTAYCHSSWTAKVTIIPVKIMDSLGEGTDADAAAGIMWSAENGADVINISAGGPEESRILQEAVNHAYNKGCVIVAAAGNNDSEAWYPAACSNVISVAATDWNDERADFSNYGKIDVSAPGMDIWSCSNWDSSTTLPAYYSGSGTSFSSPFVAGLAALVLLQNPGYGPDQVRETIERSCVDIGSAGYDKYTGRGRIDVYRALGRDFNTPEKISTYNWPNPFSPGLDLFTRIVFQVEAPSNAKVRIFDAAGSLVWEKEIPVSTVMAGDNAIKWDGRNLQGKTVGNGTYFYTIKAGSYSGRNKIMVMN